jgi:pimeloyl-ACP methyl ester carboxylesterase
MTEKLDSREEHFRIASPNEGLQLFMRYLPCAKPSGRRRAVMYVHGATFPSALSVAFRFDGRSWRDALCDAGFDVWALDFQGFGESDRYRQMSGPADAHPPLCTAADAATQLACATRFALDRSGIDRISLIAHSWGSMAAASFAAAHPSLVERMVFFGPIARRSPRSDEAPPAFPAWRIVTLEDQWKRFTEDVPADSAPVLSRLHFESWGAAYLDSDSEARTRAPAGVKVPAGPSSEIIKAWHGELPYEPSDLHAPVAIIRGEWDSLLPDEDAAWLFGALTHSRVKRDIKISRGTHLMHLESMRLALWNESIGFLRGDDVAPVPL